MTIDESCVRAPGALVHRALREAAGRGQRLEERPDRVRGAGGEELLVAVDLRSRPGLRMPRATAADSRNAMTAIASAPGTSAPRFANDGSAGGGNPCGTGAMSSTPASLEPGERHEQDAAPRRR